MNDLSKTPYSALEPAGDAARTISQMFWWLVVAALVIWLIFIALEIYVVFGKHGQESKKRNKLFIIGGGTLFPLIIITVSVYFSLLPLPKLLRHPPPGSLTIHVNGAQWWWRVMYEDGSEMVELANEIWLPVNRPVLFRLKSEDVIHSFWIPSLAGKMDMIPGRVNSLSFTPTKTGNLMGICAEYCGASHALMRLNVKVVEKDVFDEWLRNQKRPAQIPEKGKPSPGQVAFVSNGCTSCHTVRGVSTIGKVGPDLTHVGSRMRIGAGILSNDAHSLKKWIKDVGTLKPEVKMPSFETLPEEERDAIAKWLEGLK